MRALLKTADNVLQGRTHEIVHSIVRVMEESAPREFDQMMTKLKTERPRVARILLKLSNTPRDNAIESSQNERG